MRKHFTTRLPDQLAQALTERAEVNHRSANAELTAILTGAAPALSGTASAPVVSGAEISVVANRLRQYLGKANFSHGADRQSAADCVDMLEHMLEQARGLL